MAEPEQTNDLIDSLSGALAPYGYTRVETGENQGIPFVAKFMTPRRWTVRYVCALVRLPEEATELAAWISFHEDLRKSLAKQYARFPWWKELGTYTVLLCNSDQFDRLEPELLNFKDRTGFHMNVMLGTRAVDTNAFRTSADSTWGLFYSGDHFGALGETVRQWCELRRTSQ